MELKSEQGKEKHRGVKGPSIVIVTEGEGSVKGSKAEGETMEIARGEVLFIAAEEEVEWESRGKGELVLFRAFCEA